MLISIKTIKKYFKATLKFENDKFFYLYDRYFDSNRNFTT